MVLLIISDSLILAICSSEIDHCADVVGKGMPMQRIKRMINSILFTLNILHYMLA